MSTTPLPPRLPPPTPRRVPAAPAHRRVAPGPMSSRPPRGGGGRWSGHAGRLFGAVALSALLASCAEPEHPVITPLPALPTVAGAAQGRNARVNGTIGAPDAPGRALLSFGRPQVVTESGGPSGSPVGGDITLDFADTDIRDAVAQIMGQLLHLNYTIDPAVKGAVTLHTATPIARSQLLPVMQALLAQVGAELLQGGGLYRIASVGVPQNAGGGGAPNAALAEGENVGGSSVVPLHYANAEDLAHALQPFIGGGGKVVAVSGENALLVAGDANVRATLTGLISAFDVDALAGQSYALLPVESGSAKDMASALQDALRGQNKSLAEIVRVIPMTRVDAVLVVSEQGRYVNDARRLFALIDRHRRDTVRAWHVYYLQNSHVNDTANLLQQAFTPDNITVQPNPPRQLPQSGGELGGVQSGQSGLGSGGVGGGIGGGGMGGGTGGVGGFGSATGGAGSIGGGGATSGGSTTQPAPSGGGNPLLGGLEGGAGGGGQAAAKGMRIIANEQNSAILVYATERENDAVDEMLQKIDIAPLQVRIDAIVAEVDLNEALQYGTQFFFKSGGINGVLSNATTATSITGTIANTVNNAGLGAGLPGLVIGGLGNGGGPLAISALQQVTKVHVLDSPELLVVDNQPARLQVGSLVPYQSGTAQSTLTSTSQIVSEIQYQPVGVILEVTPRVNPSGEVTLDISQEVSSVAQGVTTPGVNSPTFNTRNVNSRVVVQDGQTIGIAGLITDNVTRTNGGIPWLKDIPLLGALASSQNNSRQRQELLVLITPHVIRDQHDARALTEDMREQLSGAAAVPEEIVPQTGSADPNRHLRQELGLH